MLYLRALEPSPLHAQASHDNRRYQAVRVLKSQLGSRLVRQRGPHLIIRNTGRLHIRLPAIMLGPIAQQRRHDAASRMSLRPRRHPLSVASAAAPLLGAIAVAASLPMAHGHEHNETQIPAGETVSKDPIVRRPGHVDLAKPPCHMKERGNSC